MSATPAARRRERDAALTWDVPPEVDGSALLQAQHADGAQYLPDPSRAAFGGAAERHLLALVEQLLAAEGVGSGEWPPVLVRLAQTAAAWLSPSAMAAHGAIDPRPYVKIKRLAGGGAPSDSSFVDGVAFRKNVAHKRMCTHAVRPRVLLLAGDLSWRPVHSASKISSFDMLIDQEHEQVQLAVERIASFNPDVLLVEGSVPRAAQELLLEREVALVINVKHEVLDRIACCTGAEVAPSLEALNGRCIGFCKEFEVDSLAGLHSLATLEHVPDSSDAPEHERAAADAAATQRAALAGASAPKSIMLFRGCPRQLGCSILLCGRDLGELSAVKRVAAFAVYAAYLNRLEVSFLADQLLVASLAAAGTNPDHALSAAAAELVAGESERGAAEERGQQPIVSTSPHITYRQEPGGQDPGLGTASVPAAAAAAAASPAKAQPDAAARNATSPGGSNGGEFPVVVRPPAAERGSSSSSSRGGSDRPASPLDPLSRAVREIAQQAVAAEESTVSAAVEASSDEDTETTEAPRDAGGANLAAGPGAALYGTQQLWLSISCKNPGKGTLCEPPHVHSMKFYADSDLPLAAFLAAAAPANRRCQHPQCGDGAQLHLRSFAHGDGIITLSSMRFPAGKELPGSDKGQVWFWMRPVAAGAESVSGARRLALSEDAACLSFAHLLDLLFNARHLRLPGRESLQRDFVRYIGTGSSVLCLHFSLAVPFDVAMPAEQVALACGPEAAWLREEIKQLTEEADEAFSSVAFALSEQLGGLSSDDGSQQGWVDALAESRTTFLEMVQSANSLIDKELAVEDGSLPAPGAAVQAVWELNRLRRMLALLVLEWATSLHEGLPAMSTEPCSNAAAPDAPSSLALGPAGDSRSDGAAVTSASAVDEGQGLGAEGPSQGSSSSAPARSEAIPIRNGRLWVEADYAAPSLQDVSTSPGNGPEPLDAAIPTGLVSRYVSQYEGLRDASSRSSPQQAPRPEGRTSPGLGGQYPLGSITPTLPRPSFTIDLTDPDLGYVGALSPGASGGAVLAEDGKLQQLASRLRRMSMSRGASQQQELEGMRPGAAGSLASPDAGGGAGSPECQTAPRAAEGAGGSLPAPSQPGTPVSAKKLGRFADAEAMDVPSRLQQLLSHSRSNSRGADALLGQLQLTGAGRVELSGRALLPPGADGMHITIFDDEPTSVIAYCLATQEYQQYLQEAVTSILAGGIPAAASAEHAAGGGGEKHGPGAQPHASPPRGEPGGRAQAVEAGGDAGAADEPPSPGRSRVANLRVLFSEAQLDCQLAVDDGVPGTPWGVAHFQVTAYYAPQFAELRRRCVAGGEPAFLASISRCCKWVAQGGKSNVYFAKTRDDRYIVKQLSRSERASFLAFAPDYLRHVATLLHRGQDTCLAKVLGVFQVTLAAAGGVSEVAMDLLIMENVFYGRPSLHRVYDLKGSERDRYVSDTAVPGAVLMDSNLREANLTVPTLVGPRAAAALQRAVWADTGFLAALGVMDYSLLVGVDRQRRQLVVGLIDYVRQYSWDKQVESWVKKTGILGGAGKDPTVVSPRQYSRRFRAAMASYFTVSPSLDCPAPALDPDAV